MMDKVYNKTTHCVSDVRREVSAALKICIVVCPCQCFISMPYLHLHLHSEDAGNQLPDCVVSWSYITVWIFMAAKTSKLKSWGTVVQIKQQETEVQSQISYLWLFNILLYPMQPSQSHSLCCCVCQCVSYRCGCRMFSLLDSNLFPWIIVLYSVVLVVL
jgi:hypothetical protein